MNVQTIEPRRLAELLKEGRVDLVDVRTPAEFQEVHVAGARNVPLDRLDAKDFSAARKDRELLCFICKGGSRGRQACEKMSAAGNVVNVDGGTEACVAAGLDVHRGRKVLSLERQVRIAAGSLVLLGSALAWFVHPAFLGLPAFVGAGLVFAGVTDTCGMGMMLARMPWNQAGSDACKIK